MDVNAPPGSVDDIVDQSIGGGSSSEAEADDVDATLGMPDRSTSLLDILPRQ